MSLNRVLLLVTAVDMAQLGEPLRVGAERALKALNLGGAESRVLLPIGTSEDDGTDYGRVMRDGLGNGVKLGGFDAAVELTVPASQPLPALIAGLEEIRASAGHAFDASRSVAVAGTDVVKLQGEDSVRLIYAMRRRDGTTHAEFSRYWNRRYTTVARFTPGLVGYRQMHADPDASERAAGAAGVALHDVDGIALLWYRSLRDLASAATLVGPLVPNAATPVSFREQALETERRFHDLQRATAIVAEA
jgi:hypothetical protein